MSGVLYSTPLCTREDSIRGRGVILCRVLLRTSCVKYRYKKEAGGGLSVFKVSGK